MYVQGKYWLNINVGNLDGGDYVSDFSTPPYTTKINGVVREFNMMGVENWVSDWGWYYLRYDETNDEGMARYSVAYGWVDGSIEPWYISQEARLIDFGPEPVWFGDDNAYTTQYFSALFTHIPEGNYVNGGNFADIGNRLLDLIYDEAMAQFEESKPTMTTLVTSSATGITTSLKDYDLVFICARAYTNYDPLYEVIPAKFIASLGSSFTFDLTDNSKSTTWVLDATNYNLTRSSGSGTILYACGLKLPEVN